MSKKLVHHLFGQHSLRYVPRSEVDMSPAQIFTYGGQHPPVSRILVFVSQRAFLSVRDLQSLRTGSETADAFQADGNVKASECLDIVGDLQTCSRRSEKKGHPCLCRELMSIIGEDVQTAGLCRYWRRKQQYVESGGHPTANKQVKMRSMRRQCSLHSQMLGTNYERCEQLGWRVQDKWKNDLTKKHAREELYSRYQSGIDMARRTP